MGHLNVVIHIVIDSTHSILEKKHQNITGMGLRYIEQVLKIYIL